jgi:hypothetical protein
MTDLFEAAEARAARDEAIQRISSSAANWMPRARLAVQALPAGWEGTGEDIRLHLLRLLEPPHHHNAWGALVNHCVKAGWLEWTGSIRNMRTRRSHARSTKVYRRTWQQ